MNIRDYIKENILLFDGAMGTMLQRAGLKAGRLPDLLNMTEPETVASVHAAYVKAGADVITANTFGSSPINLANTPYTVEQVVSAAVRIAKASGARYVAQDIGPLGQLMRPMGTLSFDEAYEAFAEQVKAGVRAGSDVFVVETMSDIYEAKAAVLAIREHSDLPVFCTMTYQQDGRTFVGCDPLGSLLVLEGLGADAIGANCSLGPAEMQNICDIFCEYSRAPVMMQANAGLPFMENGETVYRITADEYVRQVMLMVKKGAGIIGGCCGTTPEMISALRAAINGMKPLSRNPVKITAASSGTKTVVLDGGVYVIGERLNPTGKKRLKAAITQGDTDYILSEALSQKEHGADMLDVNLGLPEVDEAARMKELIPEIQGIVDLPLQIDSADPAAIEAGARIYNGKPLINSVSGKQDSMRRIFPVVKKYGALIVGLTLDEDGIPPTPEGRFAVAEKILKTALSYGIPREDLLIDCLTLTASAQQEQASAALEAIKLVKSRLGLKTVLGVSNVSFGLPGREILNSAFLAAAFGAGLDAPILNPLSVRMMETVRAHRVVINQDRDAREYIASLSQETVQAAAKPETKKSLEEIIAAGEKAKAADAVRELLMTKSALEIINTCFVPALDRVGKLYESGEIFLPQLLRSAETVKAAFEIIDTTAERPKDKTRGDIVIATVQGDIHDIGKNIAGMMLTNYGYNVIDLGKDVPPEKIVETVLARSIRLVGLSALMTTTVQNMGTAISALKAAGADCSVMVGGAVLSEEYAALVDADYYVRDAMEGVRVADKIFGDQDQNPKI